MIVNLDGGTRDNRDLGLVMHAMENGWRLDIV